jgi:hypothetical protein
MVEGVNSSMIYYKNFCTCHNVPPAQLKKKKKEVNLFLFKVDISHLLTANSKSGTSQEPWGQE